MTDADVRNLALNVLVDVLEKECFSHIAIQRDLNSRTDLSDRDKKFAMYLIRGTIQRKLTLDHVLEQFSKTPIKKMKPIIRTILRMSVFQILYMDSVPDRAVCNEAVRLAKRRGFQNGTDGLCRGRDRQERPGLYSAVRPYCGVRSGRDHFL